MPTIKVDGVEYEVAAGQNLLETCLELGLDLPYFCWHPAMGSVGACRQCAVVQYQDEEDQRGRIVMGCMTPVTDGAIFSIQGDRALAFREAIVESLMLNHPHDCPVCAEGGECHLQDMTVMVGHRDRHYRGRKNTHRNQYLGTLVHHEMNRCITCYRCTRYYRDYAGGTDLAAMAAHDHIYFGRHQEGNLESPFAGNLVEVCPTGVFTDKSLAHDYTRKWDLQSAPSVCVGCAVGCNTLPGERYGKLKRIHNRYNKAVNGYFLCDRGRFGGRFVNNEDRLDYPGLRHTDTSFAAIDAASALKELENNCRDKRLAGIGSPRASLESNYMLQQLVGSENYCSGCADDEQALLQRILAHLGSNPAQNPSLQDVESADAILVLGEDITHTAPRVALSLRQSVRNKAYAMAAKLKLETWQDAAIRNLAQDQRSPLHITACAKTDLDDVAATVTCLPSDDQARLAMELAAVLGGADNANPQLQRIAEDLAGAQRPLIISGTAANSEALVDAAADIARKLCEKGSAAMLSFCLPEANSLGTALLSHSGGCSLKSLADRAQRGEIDTLIIVENDLYRRAHRDTINTIREHVPCIIGLDCIESDTLAICDLVLPANAFTECEGTLVSSEGRAQRFFPVHVPAAERRASWQWLRQIASSCDRNELASLEHFDDLCLACSQGCELLSSIGAAAPDHEFRSRGLKIPRQPHRYSGRTAMRANVSVHEPKQPVDEDSALAYTMEGSADPDRPGALLPYVWSPGWNSNQSLHKFQEEVGGSLRGGTAGVRLLDELNLPAPRPADAPAAFHARSGEYLLQAGYRIYGSEELSARSPGIADMVGRAGIALNPADAADLGCTAGDGVQIGAEALEVAVCESVPIGCAVFSAGYSATRGLRSGDWTALHKAESWQRTPEVIGSDGGGSHD
jgi:NADH-quinone oxidoreductase subunit G